MHPGWAGWCHGLRRGTAAGPAEAADLHRGVQGADRTRIRPGGGPGGAGCPAATRRAVHLAYLAVAEFARYGRGKGAGGKAGRAACPQYGISRDRQAEEGERKAHGGTGPHQSRAGGRGKSARALGTALRERGLRREAAEVIDAASAELESLTCTRTACELPGKSRATLHRQRNPRPAPERSEPAVRAPHPASLTREEQAALLAVLNSDRFGVTSPAQVRVSLLDEGIYLASLSSMYRVLRAADQVRERRAQAAHPPRVRPELVADGPRQGWAWGIAKLKGA